MLRLSTLLVMLACCPPSILSGQTNEHARGEGWGSVAGRVVFDGELGQPALKLYRQDERLIIDAKTRGIKNAIVYLKSKPERVHSSFATDKPPKSAKLVCRDGQFVPRAMILQVGQPLLLVSEETDGAAHFKSQFFTITNFDFIVQRGKPVEWTPPSVEGKVGPCPIKSGAARDFREGLAAAEIDKKWGFIDRIGDFVIPAQFESASFFSEGLAAVTVSGKTIFIKKDGKRAIELEYEEAYNFAEGLSAFKSEGKWGFIDNAIKFIHLRARRQPGRGKR